MKTPDQIFDSVKHYLPAPSRMAARITYRRILREFYIHRSNRVYSPATGLRIDKQQIGARYRFTGNRFRHQKIYPLRPSKVGRPTNDAVQGLVHRLAHIWIKATNSRTTISHRRFGQSLTKWELFVQGTLAGLGYFNYRRYVERHSKLV